MMNADTREAAYQLLKDFAQSSIKSYDIEALKKAYPFHRLFFDDDGFIAFKRERSVVTKMGQRLYPALAELIAKEHYKNVALEHEITGQLNRSTVNAISTIVRELRSRQRQPDHTAEMAEVLSANRIESRKPVEVRINADLYIGDFHKGPLFAEIKSPLPNLDICAETKHKLLIFTSLLNQHNPHGYLVFPYNPFITRSAYKHSVTKRIMDMQSQVLMGSEFWDKTGGTGTFDHLLEIIDMVGEELRLEKDQS